MGRGSLDRNIGLAPAGIRRSVRVRETKISQRVCLKNQEIIYKVIGIRGYDLESP
jgi:hypothetical protein